MPIHDSRLVAVETLGDGTEIHFRPMRPDDEPLLQDLFVHMTPEDRRFRFFMTMTELSHEFAARLSHVDGIREIALIAQPAFANTALGVARYSADLDNQHAEFAIAVRSDWKARGLGHLLMTRLIATARERNIGVLVGEVLRDNVTMLQLCRDLGFLVANRPDDPTTLGVALFVNTERLSTPPASK